MSIIGDFITKLIKAAAEWVDKCLPNYEPSVWNDNIEIQHNNNCYNYGCDIQTNTYAQPGRAHDITLTSADLNNCTKVTKAAIADGLVSVNCDEGCGCKECWHQVALVISPGWDYHWYRKDKDGKWSHKMAWTPATNLDNSGNIITDPKTADRGSYTIFCGCFCVNKSKVIIN
ncbi:MAG: hypothetical protein KAJ44_01930 [Thermoplasmatales archaeon]|nr:hypothetical protein [Thermoplasmatales archaeon]